MQLLGGSLWGTFFAVMFLMTAVTFFAVSIITRGMFQTVRRVINEQILQTTGTMRSTMSSQLHRWADREVAPMAATVETPGMWTYLVYLGHCLLTLPAGEIMAAKSLYGLLRESDDVGATSIDRRKSDQLKQSPNQEQGQEAFQNPRRLHSRVQTALQRIGKPEEPPPRKDWSLPIRQGLLIGVRILLLCIWIPLFVFEYILVLVSSLLRPKTWIFNPSHSLDTNTDTTSFSTLLLAWFERFFRFPLTILAPTRVSTPETVKTKPKSPQTPQAPAAPTTTSDASRLARNRMHDAANTAMGMGMRRPLLAPITPTTLSPSPSLTTMSGNSRCQSPMLEVGGRPPILAPAPVRVDSTAAGPRAARRRLRTSQDLELGALKV